MQVWMALAGAVEPPRVGERGSTFVPRQAPRAIQAGRPRRLSRVGRSWLSGVMNLRTSALSTSNRTHTAEVTCSSHVAPTRSHPGSVWASEVLTNPVMRRPLTIRRSRTSDRQP